MTDPAAPTRESVVTLREITADSVRAICTLAVTEDQLRFVAPNAISIAQAHFAREAWFRAIYADETPVGFAMISDKPEVPEYILWRFMIDTRHQLFGFGRRAIELLVAHVRTRPGATAFMTSAVPGEGSPQAFYEKLGFAATGDVEDGEVVLRLEL
jgi:diamine N-acetyltransferase